MKKILLVAALLLSSGCAVNTLNGTDTYNGNQYLGSVGANTPATGPINSVLGIDKYYPLDRTFTWTYRVTIREADKTSVFEDVTRIDSVSGSGASRTANYSSSRREDGALTSQGNGTIVQTPSSLTVSGESGSEVISLPLASGKAWTSGSLNARCYGVGTLAVAGKAYKDVLAIAYTKDGETKAVRWLAPGAGVIKQLASVQIDGEKTEVLSELVSAQVSAVTAVSMTPTALSLTPGATASVKAQVFYEDGSIGREFSLSTSDPTVATVNSSGLVQGISAGNTVLTAISSQDSTKAATMSIEVR